MTRRQITSGSTFERDIGYARAVVVGGWVFVSGTTGFDYATMAIAEDAPSQARQALLNIEAALAEAGAALTDVVRVRYILPTRADFEPCWPILRKAFDAAPPAATMIVAGLSDPRMKIEIEVTAVAPKPSVSRVGGGQPVLSPQSLGPGNPAQHQNPSRT